MANPNILLLRIDNRLVHGQVGVAWSSSLGANLLLVADDGVAQDPLQQQIMSMTAESMGIGIRFFSLQKPSILLAKRLPRRNFIVCRTPQEARFLVEGGVPIKSVNVGNMHFVEGKRAITKKFTLTIKTWITSVRFKPQALTFSFKTPPATANIASTDTA